MTSAAAGGNGQAPTQQPASPAGGNGQAPTPAQVNNTASPSGGQNGQAPTATPTDPTPSADEWRRIQQELAEARRDAGKYRDELKKRDDAAMTDQQKRDRDFENLQTKNFEYEARFQRQALEIAGLRLAPNLGIADPGAALALVQAEHAHEVKFSAETGQPENLEALLKQVLTAHPVLAAAPQQQQSGGQQGRQSPPSSGGATNPGRQVSGAAQAGGLTPEIIAAMSNRERVARYAEIQAWREANPQAVSEWAERIRPR